MNDEARQELRAWDGGLTEEQKKEIKTWKNSAFDNRVRYKGGNPIPRFIFES